MGVSSLCLITGCISASVNSESMRHAAKVFHSKDPRIALQSVFSNDISFLVPNRSREMNWNVNETANLVARRMTRPTYMPLAIHYQPLMDTYNETIYVRDMNSDKQAQLQQEWSKRVVSALMDSVFDCDVEGVNNALQKGKLLAHYFLVARHNSAEMGHSDVVKLIFTNQEGVIVARTKPEYSLDYPLGFVDRTDWPYEFLF